MRALAFRRSLRRNSTDAERLLWQHLRAHRFADLKFRRQHPCGAYVLDFYCPRLRLAVELDGGQHFVDEALAYDRRRTAFLEEQRIHVLRFQNDVLLRETERVLDEIARASGVA
jgi:very-short-patch-repair endonuclease